MHWVVSLEEELIVSECPQKSCSMKLYKAFVHLLDKYISLFDVAKCKDY